MDGLKGRSKRGKPGRVSGVRTSAVHAAPSAQSGLPQTSALSGTSEIWRLSPHTGKLRPREEKVLYR